MAPPGEARLTRPTAPALRRGAAQPDEEIVARLREIAAGATVAPEDAFEPALRVILEATGCAAGAICVHDQRHEMLWLAAEVGLSDEGCRSLRNVRRGSAVTWDMPLHGLLNRRAYLIDSASRNRYVPPLVEQVGSVRTIACLPLYNDSTPMGSLVLIALAPRMLGENDIRTLAPPLREVVAMIEAVRKRAAAVAGASSSSSRNAPATPPKQAPVREREAHAGGTDDPSLVAAAMAKFRAADRERERLAAALEAATTERTTQVRHLSALESQVVESTTEIEWTRLRLADAEAAASKAHERACEAERERERAGVALDAATARERALQGELEAALQRAAEDLDGRASERALEVLRAQTTAEIEAARQQAAVEVESLRATLASTESVVRALEDEARSAHDQIARLEEAAAAGSAQEVQAHELTQAHEREHQARIRVAELEAQVGTLRGECTTLAARVEEAEKTRVEAMRREVDAVRERLEADLAQARGREAEAHARAASAETEVAALRQECAALNARVAEAVRAQEEATRLELDRARAQLEHELEEARGREERTRARLTELETEVAGVRDERTRLAANLETLSEDRDRLREALATLEAVEETVEPAEPATDLGQVVEEVLQAEEPPAPSAPAPGPRPTPAAPPAGQTLVALLDTDATWQKAAPAHCGLTLVQPSETVGEEVARLGASQLIVNLAAPGVFPALAAIRAAGVTAPLWACLADPGANRAIALGRVEPALRPLDPEAVLVALGAGAGRGTKVVTIGTDVDALMSLRQIFARQGLSVSMAWDVKQAADLLAMIHPTLVVVDLEQPPRVGYGIVARLAGADPIPTTVLISSGEKDPAAGFRTALADPAHNPRALTLARVLGQLMARAADQKPVKA